MLELTRSRVTLTVAAIAAGLLALGAALTAIGGAVLSSESTLQTTKDLLTAGAWVQFGGWLLGFVAVGSLAWAFVLAGRTRDLWEVAAATMGALLLAIAGLLLATEAQSSSDGGGHVVMALGLGTWTILAIVVAGMRSVAESKFPGGQRTSPFWLAAGGALIAVAVGSGIPSPVGPDGTSGVVAGIIAAVGFAALVGTFGVARSRRMIGSRAFPALAVGIGLLAAGEVAWAVTSATVFSASAGLTTLRVMTALHSSLEAFAFLALAGAAWQRLDEAPAHLELSRLAEPASMDIDHAPDAPPVANRPAGQPAQTTPTAQVAPPQQAAVPMPESPARGGADAGAAPSASASGDPKFCRRCGAPLLADSVFCSRCGTSVASGPSA